MNEYYVYEWYNIDTNEVFYVGKGKKDRSRSKSVSIKDGDTLSEIAARNHTTVSKLRKLNNIKGNNIRAGKKIRIK